MFNKVKLLFINTLLLINFCIKANYCQAQTIQKPILEPSVILKDLVSFLQYRQQYLELWDEFSAYDMDGRTL